MEILFKAEAIAERLTDMTSSLNKLYASAKAPVNIVVTLNGAFMFAADLVRQLNFPIVLHFTGGTFFEGTTKQEVIISPSSLPQDFHGNPVILIEDMLDSGKTVAQLHNILKEHNAGDIKVVTLLKRQGGKGYADLCGFTVPRQLFVVGYGLDQDGRYRELKDIYTIGTNLSGNTVGMC